MTSRTRGRGPAPGADPGLHLTPFTCPGRAPADPCAPPAPPGPLEPPDLRLVAPAAAVWLSALVALRLPPGRVLIAAAVLTGAGALLLRRARRHRSTTRRERTGTALLAAVLLCCAAAGFATALRVHARTSGPLHAAAAGAAAVTVEGTLLDDPRVTAPRPGRATLVVRELVVARLRVEVMRAAGREVRLRTPVLVLSGERAWLALLPGARVRVEGRVRAAGPGEDVAAVLSARGPPRVLTQPGPGQRAAGALRAGLRRAVSPLPAAERGLLPGLVVGDVSQLDPGLQQDFRTTGLTHLTAVSGTNVAVVLAAVLLVCARLGVPLRARPLAAGAALAAFVVLARPSPSVLRAAVMGGIALLALGSGLRRRTLPALCAAVVVLLLVSPELAVTPGFALSVLATAGLLVLAPGWRDRLSRSLPRWLAEALAVPAAAQVVCGPVVVALSAQLGLLSVPANLLAVPAVAPATVLGVAAALVSPVCLPAAQGLAWLAYLPTAWLVRVARVGATLPGASVPWRGGAVGAALLVGLTLALAVLLRGQFSRRLLAAAAAGPLVVTVCVAVLAPGWPPAGWFLVTCDVGQGDALVLSAGAHAAVVIDTGPDPVAVDACLRRLHVRHVPLLVLTHLHADHVEGVPGVLRGRDVGAIELGPLDEPAVERDRVLRWAAARHVPVAKAVVGEQRRARRAGWQVLAPPRAFHGTTSDPNNSSLVLRLKPQGGPVVLLTGDIEVDAQRALLASGTDLRATVLKVPHHGSDHQDPDFLRAVGARVVLTSVGAGNPYGHPSARTLSQLVDQGARSYRTDRDGDVALVLRGARLLSVARHGPGEVSGAARRTMLAGTDISVRPADAPGPANLFCTPTERPAGPPPRTARGPPVCQDEAVPTHDAPAAVTLVVGDEELLVSRQVRAAVQAACAGEEGVDVRDLDASQLGPGDLAELFSPSLFSERRVVVLRGAQDLGRDVAAEVTAYAADPLPEVVLVVVHAGAQKGKALLGALVDAGVARVDVPRLTRPAERRDFVRAELRADGRPVAEDAVLALLDAVGNDLRELSSASSQLLSDTDGPITLEAVLTYHRGRAEAGGFAVAERAVEGDLAGALELLRWGQATGLAHVLVTSALASTLRSVAMVASAGRSQPAGRLAAQLSMPAWKVEKSQRQARGWRPEGLSDALQAVARADAAVKGAAADPDHAVDKVLLQVVRARGRVQPVA